MAEATLPAFVSRFFPQTDLCNPVVSLPFYHGMVFFMACRHKLRSGDSFLFICLMCLLCSIAGTVSKVYVQAEYCVRHQYKCVLLSGHVHNYPPKQKGSECIAIVPGSSPAVQHGETVESWLWHCWSMQCHGAIIVNNLIPWKTLEWY